MSCGWNIFCHVLGDPAPDSLNKSFKSASAALLQAKASGDKIAIQAALNKMKAVNAQQRTAANNVADKIQSIDTGVATIGSAAGSVLSAGNRVLVVIGLVAAWALFKKT